jgi:hypothetical protein
MFWLDTTNAAKNILVASRYLMEVTWKPSNLVTYARESMRASLTESHMILLLRSQWEYWVEMYNLLKCAIADQDQNTLVSLASLL